MQRAAWVDVIQTVKEQPQASRILGCMCTTQGCCHELGPLQSISSQEGVLVLSYRLHRDIGYRIEYHPGGRLERQ